jgi:dTDP-4-amino-4,6-dideoxygalactose transaminase
MRSDSRPNDRLAIDGGAPVRAAPMPPRLALGEAEEAMIAECLAHYREHQVDPGYQGHFEERYCRAFEVFMGGGHADAVATGTASLYVALAALNLPRGSEVLVSPITDPGTLSSVILNGLVPKLMDSMPNNYNVGAAQLLDRIDAKTKGAIIVHSIGQAAPADEFVEAAHAHGVKVLEDCSQSHGATWKGRKVGTFGDIAAFSTMYRKAHMTGPSGGVVYCRNQELFHQALAHADRGKPRWREDFDDRDPSNYLFPALNFHTDEISCAIGLASLARLPASINARLAFVRGVEEGLKSNSVCRPYPATSGDSPFVYPVFVEADEVAPGKAAFAKALIAEGIPLNPHYKYLARDWAWLQRYLADEFDTVNARAARDRSFCLYLNEKYGAQEVEDVATALDKVSRLLGKNVSTFDAERV